MKHVLRCLPLLVVLLSLAGCGEHISGTVQDVHVTIDTYPCGSVKKGYHTCVDTHRYIFVNNIPYEYDNMFTNVEKGDHVSFDYSWAMGVNNFKDDTQHNDFNWWMVLCIVVLLTGGGGFAWKYFTD
jgi:hypothetical protein